jgi:hypothetical protein
MSLDEATLQSLFDRAQRSNPDGMKFTPEESDRFRKSFEDPEFRKLFAEYMDELQDPKNREETESYISQLEGEQKVPEGKELIRYQRVCSSTDNLVNLTNQRAMLLQARTCVCCKVVQGVQEG